MTAVSISLQLICLLIICMIPWPGPTVFKITCPRDNAAIVRKLVQKKWIPVLDKYQVRLPLQCPFHPSRDIYQPQEAAKIHYRSSHWTCDFCGKSFYAEKYLDLHFDNRHKNKINMAEDAVCLSDYCDIMRCEVLQAQEVKSDNNLNIGPQTITTDLEVWREPSQRNTALTLITPKPPSAIGDKKITTPSTHSLCNKYDEPITRKTKRRNETDSGKCRPTLIDSAKPPKQKFIELQKLRANCKPEELLKLKIRCETLVRDCITGLLVNLSVQDFKDVEVELNNAVCWYLTCDRYWEDAPNNPKHFSWALFFIPAIILSVGLTICYYIIWVIYDTDEGIAGFDDDSKLPAGGVCYTTQYGEEYYSADENSSTSDHYIYVTYPPEIEKRLLDNEKYYIEESEVTTQVITQSITVMSKKIIQ